ncbi:inositol monophosphatase [bacterium]|nr:inositol monophosphatase [bacterium]
MFSNKLNIVIKIAKQAGAFLIDRLNSGKKISIEIKAVNDFVTEVDKQAESLIVSLLKKSFPDYGIMAEENYSDKTIPPNLYWVIDPLDGTTNYIHGFPSFCVSIGLCENKTPLMGVIYDPTRDELFCAQTGKGAFLNGSPITVSETKNMQGALIGTGFPFRNFAIMEKYLDCFSSVLKRCQGIRRPGSAAIDLAYVACGRLDAFWEHGLHPWDCAAGSIIIKEAGGTVTDFTGGKDYLFSRTFIASNTIIHNEIQEIVISSMPLKYPF